MKISNTVKGVACVCGAFLINFTLGTMYTFGNMSPYIASYLRLKTDNIWVTTGDTVWIFASNFVALAVFMPVGGLLSEKIGSRLTCLFGSWSMSLSVIMTYFTIKENLWLVIMTYGGGFGFGIGISYSVALSTSLQWFPLHRGVVSGIVVGGFGLGALLFNIVQTKFINPLNISPTARNMSENSTEYLDLMSNVSILTNASKNITFSSQKKYFFDESLLNKVPMCFIVLGVTYAVIQLLGVILLTDPGSLKLKENIKMEELSVTNEEVKNELLHESLTSQNKSHGIEKTNLNVTMNMDFSVLEALRRKMFWHLWLTLFLNGLGLVTIMATYKNFGQQFISDDQYFAILGACGGICNCLGRVVWGRLYDISNYRITMSAVTAMMTFLMGIFYFSSFISNTLIAKMIYFFMTCFLFLNLAGTFAILPSVAAQYFGSTNFATIYGLLFSGLASASLLGAIISSFFFHVVQYEGQFIIATVASFISLILTQFFKPPQPRAVIIKNNIKENLDI